MLPSNMCVGNGGEGLNVQKARSGLWVPPNVALLVHRATKRTVTLPDGRRALITVDDSRTVRHTETANQLDVLVRPKTITVKIAPRGR